MHAHLCAVQLATRRVRHYVSVSLEHSMRLFYNESQQCVDDWSVLGAVQLSPVKLSHYVYEGHHFHNMSSVCAYAANTIGGWR